MLKIIRLLWLKVKVWFMFKVIRHCLRCGNSVELIALAIFESTGINYEVVKNIVFKEKFRMKESRRDKRRFVKELYELRKIES